MIFVTFNVQNFYCEIIRIVLVNKHSLPNILDIVRNASFFMKDFLCNNVFLIQI